MIVFAWIIFAVCMTALAALFLGGICHGAGLADRELERLEREEREI